jgi:Leucine-rich repeat (LRR) protein
MLEGSIPPEIGQLTMMTTLTLGPNLFTGDMQTSISALTNLRELSIRDVGIGGRLPASFGAQLTNLVTLIISDTQVEGNIETFFGALTKLVSLDLSGNNLRSAVPSELGNLRSLSKFVSCICVEFCQGMTSTSPFFCFNYSRTLS